MCYPLFILENIPPAKEEVIEDEIIPKEITHVGLPAFAILIIIMIIDNVHLFMTCYCFETCE